MFRGWAALLASAKEPDGVVQAPYDPELTYPNPWGGLKEPVNPYTAYHRERTGRLLSWMAPIIAQDTETIRHMREFERRQPAFQTTGGEAFTLREAGSATAKLVFRGRDGRTRVLVENFTPSMEYPDVYPNGFWLSPDGRHVIYSAADPVHEGGATLHIVRTDTGQEIATPLSRAKFPSGSWIDPKRFVYSVLTPDRPRPWIQHWTTYIRHVHDDGTVSDERLPAVERRREDSRYDFVPGPLPGTVTVLGYSHILNTPQSIKVVDLDGLGRGFTVQEEAERVLGRVRPGPVEPDGRRRLFVLRLDRRSFRAGRVVVVDPPRRPGGRPRIRQIVAGRRGDVIREIEVIDRGTGQLPALALSIRRHGGEVRVDIVEFKKAARWRGGLAVAHRWTPQLPGAQEVTIGRRGRKTGRSSKTGKPTRPGQARKPAKSRKTRKSRSSRRSRRSRRTQGWYGTISTMTATRGNGGGGLDIEYAARESVPHRLYRLTTVDPEARPRVIAGPTLAEARAAGVPEVEVTRHRVRVGWWHRTSVHVVRPTHVPKDVRVPTMYTAYPYFFLGGHNQNFTPFAAAIVAKGVAWTSHSVYGTGAHSYGEQLGPRASARRRALREVLAATRYLDRQPGLAGKEGRIGFFQSAGGFTGLDVLRYASPEFRAVFFNRPTLSLLNEDNFSHPVHMNLDNPLDRRAAYAASGGIREAVRRPPEHVVFTLGSTDPRIPDYSVRATAAAFDEARSRYFGDKTKQPGGTYLIEQEQSGHFPGGNEQGVIAAVIGYLAGVHPRPRPAANTGTAPTVPGVTHTPNRRSDLSRAQTPPREAAHARNTDGGGPAGQILDTAKALTPLTDLRGTLPRWARWPGRADRQAVREATDRVTAVEKHVPALARTRAKKR